jgi:hypothetical protein
MQEPEAKPPRQISLTFGIPLRTEQLAGAGSKCRITYPALRPVCMLDHTAQTQPLPETMANQLFYSEAPLV